MSKVIDREALKKKSASLKEAISNNFDDIKSNSEDVSKAVLIGGGVIFAGYLIYRMLRSDSHDHENLDDKSVIVVNNSAQESTIVKSIKNAIATFILAIAKQKLAEYLNKRENNNTDNA